MHFNLEKMRVTWGKNKHLQHLKYIFMFFRFIYIITTTEILVISTFLVTVSIHFQCIELSVLAGYSPAQCADLAAATWLTFRQGPHGRISVSGDFFTTASKHWP